MDWPDADPQMLRGELINLRRINALTGTLSLVRDAVLRLTEELPAGQIAEIVDLATGSGDHPVSLAHAFRRVGRAASITAVDRHPVMLEEACEFTRHLTEIHVEAGDILSLDYPDRRFDVAICSFALHHFARHQVVRILREMDRISRVGFVVHDLTRSYLGAAAAWIGTHALTTNAMSRRDGYLSVLNAFTAAELQEMATEAGAPDLKVEHDGWLRWLAVKG